MKLLKKFVLFTGLLLTIFFVYCTTVVLKARAETLMIVQDALNSKRMTLELNDFTNEQLQVLIKIQDPNFYHHKGFDIYTRGAGVTTISQGLVKMYYFDDFKPGIQKIKQILIARYAFDIMTPKDTILKLFINDVYLGQYNGKEIRGFEDAAKTYINKSFKELTWDEYLGLIAMIRAPNKIHYVKNKEINKERVLRIKKVWSGEYIPINNGDWQYGQKIE